MLHKHESAISLSCCCYAIYNILEIFILPSEHFGIILLLMNKVLVCMQYNLSTVNNQVKVFYFLIKLLILNIPIKDKIC